MRANIGEQKFEIAFTNDALSQGTINGKGFDLDLVRNGNHFHLLVKGKSYNAEFIEMNTDSKTVHLKINGNMYEVALKDRFDDLLEELGMDHLTDVQTEDLKAPMPGLVIGIEVAVGDVVQTGDPLLILEAMKMENVLKSNCDGQIKEICVVSGEAVEKNTLLVKFE